MNDPHGTAPACPALAAPAPFGRYGSLPALLAALAEAEEARVRAEARPETPLPYAGETHPPAGRPTMEEGGDGCDHSGRYCCFSASLQV